MRKRGTEISQSVKERVRGRERKIQRHRDREIERAKRNERGRKRET